MALRCLAELEKVYEIAVNGSDDEKISAAAILCGAFLTRGWNIQEHTVLFITRLLSPPVPADSSGESYLIGCAPYLNVILLGVTTVDCVQIFSLHGLRLFRQDLLVASLFQNFLLAERIMSSANCSPVSYPMLPPTHQHHMWDAWDMAAKICLAQLPVLVEDPNAEF